MISHHLTVQHVPRGQRALARVTLQRRMPRACPFGGLVDIFVLRYVYPSITYA
jgi:hypothetical protein